ncbi:MAG TPA: sugar kinase [Candidatus Sumerlaeota bacterium]|nr:sugar kinase [Candidatus Sumerlaeota bacterium]HPK02787.1 sugar kinase [Candidatus Sumerlaeota bacterium]
MSPLSIKGADSCRWDAIALGEIMIRLDPGEGRVRTARTFHAWEGGGEYNVIRGLRRCFGLRTAVVTAIADNDIGRLLEDLILQGGVDTRYIQWVPFDGIGRRVRVGLNFTERGFGVRAARGTNDRGHTAASQMKPGQVDWERVFKHDGARWFHTGGIFAGLSETTPDVMIEAMEAARAAGTMISYDLNYRASLWKDIGGQARAREVNQRVAHLVDVMIGNEEDFSAALGYEVEGADLEKSSELDPAAFQQMIRRVVKDYPNFKAVATTLRNAKTATVNDWSAVLYCDGEFYKATDRPNLEIFDRVGGGDSFASGLIYGFMTGKSPQQAVEYGAAHGALAMTTPGDTTMASLDEVEKLIKGGSARIAR